MADRRGLLIILSSPSGAGKSTLAKRLMAWDTDLEFSISATTRAPRPGEEHGREYFFLSEDEFKQQVAEGQMLEHAHVFGNFYGSPAEPVRNSINTGKDVLFDVDWQGEVQIRNSDLGKHALSIFILPPSIPELRRRLETRGQDSDDVIGKRMLKSWDEISHWGYYDYVLINDDLEATEEKLKTIVSAERMRRIQQPKLQQHVRKLQNEFEGLS
ncbi:MULTISPECIES: guanylate kinase [unclassified Ruegeria]|uniref:guanylate kinase n=1 Tax=unclassified Ruegeria TaxID=2625375 RepID=UPI00148920AB|nr:MULTISPECIES: guanylate kinase [unclassified Ruegeria]NOD33446.1 guanylate kinase [Ruegeria sp. HKCCD7296]NOD46238.1 guanylate kinase [Ruegeria sp. HKCCD5849]NOD50462.1 guanylate kinase [Ruegeria sp. HKCCD5851]NOD63336.1 guanylate kinase [Ruegeria sp. HKCCD6109]NOD67278.1 guanylate kinase [Ruegeria sp. HKCCD7303]